MSVYKKFLLIYTKSNIYKNVPIYNINWQKKFFLKRKEFNKEILKDLDINFIDIGLFFLYKSKIKNHPAITIMDGSSERNLLL